MRFKFVLATLGLGAVCLMALTLIPPKSRTSSTGPAVVSELDSPPSLPRAETAEVAMREERPNDQLVIAGVEDRTGLSRNREEGASAEAGHEAYVEARTAELRNLSGKTDSAALEVLLSEVKNPDPEIRQAALDALIQSGQRSTIPRLEQAAGQVDDPATKQAIAETVEFLKLPTLTETLRQFGSGPGR